MNFYAFTALIAVLSLLTISIITLLKAENNSLTRVFVNFNVFVGLWALGCFLESAVTQPLIIAVADKVLYSGAVFAPAIYLHLILTLTGENRSKKYILIFGYIISFLFQFLNLIPALRIYFISDVRYIQGFRFISSPSLFWYIFVSYYIVFGLYTLSTIFHAYCRAFGLSKEQLKYFILSTILLATGGILYFLLVLGINQLPIDNLFTISYAFITSYAIIRYRLIDVNILLTRAGIFILIYAFFIGVPLWFGLHSGKWLIVSFVIASLSSISPFIYGKLRVKVENAMLAKQRRYQKVLMKISADTLKIHDSDHLLKLIVYALKWVVGIDYVSAYIYDDEKKIYAQRIFRGNFLRQLPLSIPGEWPLIDYMQKMRQILIREELPRDLFSVDKWFDGICLIIPINLHKKLQGFFVIGNKQDNSAYSFDDIDVFTTLMNQISLSIENCHYMDASKRQQTLFAAEKIALIGGMAEGIAHQINNRLNQFALVGAEILLECEGILDDFESLYLKKEALKEKINYIKQCSSSIDSNVRKTQVVVQGILKFSLTECASNDFQDISMNEIITQCNDLLKIKHQIDNLPVVLDIGNNDIIYGIKSQILECILNTLDNAYEAIKEKMDYRLDEAGKKDFVPSITIALEKCEKSCIIAISDNGVGIKEEDKLKVFGAFFTTKPSSKSGSGIGAYVVRRMIEENHKGKIWFESEYMKGTTFYLELPLKAQMEQ